MRCIIVDDEDLALDLLEDSIKKIPHLELIARCSDGLEALKALQDDKVDLLITDINMPGLTGSELVKSLVDPPMVIMLTAYENYALGSYDLGVIDYLLKPVSFERFLKAVNKASEYLKLKTQQKPNDPGQERDFIFLNADYYNIKVVFREVIFIEGVGDYVKLHFANNPKPLLIRSLLKNMEELLPARYFLRIHKSYVVNKDHITHIRGGVVYLNKIELPIGITYKADVEQYLQNNQL